MAGCGADGGASCSAGLSGVVAVQPCACGPHAAACGRPRSLWHGLGNAATAEVPHHHVHLGRSPRAMASGSVPFKPARYNTHPSNTGARAKHELSAGQATGQMAHKHGQCVFQGNLDENNLKQIGSANEPAKSIS